MTTSGSSRVPEFGRPGATEFEIGKKTHRVADVPPMDVDGVRTMTIGTIVWALVVIGLVPFWGTLQADGRQWWLWTAIAGFGLGLVGIEYCRLRRDTHRDSSGPATTGGRRGRAASSAPTTSADPASGETSLQTPPRPSRPVGSRRKN